MLANTLSILALAISISTLLLARRGYLREKAWLRALEARYPHLADRAAKK
jgi:heme exporter protein D